jgi:4-amino-4-deoxy-L-arabinose transferase-like glycosyltransferase
MDANLASPPEIGRTAHFRNIAILMLLALGVLTWLYARTDLLFADGLRYIAQAQRIENGAWRDGVQGSVDHPIYPLSIAAVHSLRGGSGPESWQAAAQIVSIVAGVLLVLPCYLVALELFGPRSAWLAVFLFLLAPQTGPILADVLSEGTFLLFWLWGFYAALRFLRNGSFAWLPFVILCGGLAYLTRPEGILLPAATVLTLLLTPLFRATRPSWSRWLVAVGIMMVGPALLMAPYVVMKGGIATKPAVGRLLGLAPRSPADAVERGRPLDPNETELDNYRRAVSTVASSVGEAVTPWLLPLSAVGLIWAFRPLGARARVALMLGLVLTASMTALVRLYVTGGYCTPRHAIAPGFLLIAAAAFGLERLLDTLWGVSGRSLGVGRHRFAASAVWVLVLCAFVAASLPALGRPVNHTMQGYRQAGCWIAQNVPVGSQVADATGWSLYYGAHPGYTFATLRNAPKDTDLRWVVVREAHLLGPWWYCQVMRTLVGNREPVRMFPPRPDPGQSRVYIFDRQTPEVAQVSWQSPPERRK